MNSAQGFLHEKVLVRWLCSNPSLVQAKFNLPFVFLFVLEINYLKLGCYLTDIMGSACSLVKWIVLTLLFVAVFLIIRHYGYDLNKLLEAVQLFVRLITIAAERKG